MIPTYIEPLAKYTFDHDKELLSKFKKIDGNNIAQIQSYIIVPKSEFYIQSGEREPSGRSGLIHGGRKRR